ncbi:MAG: T9SS type A sorting domain-containing protein [Chitinophagales bacterium]|nr:T9SS type A sorting domain-containing protein [Chitinophagales bacterium]
MFPNPCNDLLHVTGGLGKAGFVNVYNVLGEQLLYKEWNAGENHFTFNTLNLPEGTYVMLIEEGDKVFTKSFIIQH